MGSFKTFPFRNDFGIERMAGEEYHTVGIAKLEPLVSQTERSMPAYELR